jgi:4-aminobutyrate aminotransferase-like enzyme
MALAQIQEITRQKLVERSARLGEFLLQTLRKTLKGHHCNIRGLGLMAGVELLNEDGTPACEQSLRSIKALLHRGFIFLPEGPHANVISFTPPLTLSEAQLASAVQTLAKVLEPKA